MTRNTVVTFSQGRMFSPVEILEEFASVAKVSEKAELRQFRFGGLRTFRRGEETPEEVKERSRRAKIKRHARIEAGVCPACPDVYRRPLAPGKAFCEECGARHTALVRARRERLREAGLCMNCGKRPRSDTAERCEPCRQLNNARSRAARRPRG